MLTASYLVALRNQITQAGPHVGAALHHDPLVWAALQEPLFVRTALDEACGAAEDWTPARLGLLALKQGWTVRDLAAEPLAALEGDEAKAALVAFEETLRSNRPPRTLADAARLALALRERRRRTGVWKGLLNELLPRTGPSELRSRLIWQTPLAIAYGLTPDPDGLLDALVSPQQAQPMAGLFAHLLQSQPITLEERVGKTHERIRNLPLPLKVRWLRYLDQVGEVEWVRQLAARLAVDADLAAGHGPRGDERLDWSMMAAWAETLQSLAALRTWAGQTDEASLRLRQVEQVLRHWQLGARLQAGTLESLDPYESDETLLDDWALQGCEVSAPAATPLSRLSLAWAAWQQGEHEEAVEQARAAAEDWSIQLATSTRAPFSEFGLARSPILPIEWLLAMGLPDEAARCGEHLLAGRPADEALATRVADALRLACRPDACLALTDSLLLANPNDVTHLRRAAGAWSDLNEWSQSLALWQLTLAQQDSPSNDDLLAAGRVCWLADHLEEAEGYFLAVLERETDHSLAATYLGLVARSRGEHSLAIERIARVTTADPDLTFAWLELANCHDLLGDADRAIEVLRTGLTIRPEDAELNGRLAQYLLQAGLTSEALPHLRKAAAMAPASTAIAVTLAKALRTLGHGREALEVIERARRIWPQEPSLAFVHGDVLRGEGDLEAALPCFELAAAGDRAELAWCLTYADALLAAYRTQARRTRTPDERLLTRALHVLQRTLNDLPELLPARVMMAETVLLKGHDESAFGRFSQLMETDDVDAEWSWRVRAGMGEAALRLGRLETALVAFQAAVQLRPEDLSLNQRTSEAFFAAQLLEEATEAAERALQLAPANVDNLLWYANQCMALGRLDRAEDALQQAVNQSTDRADLLIRLAEVRIRAGRPVDALDVLAAVAHVATATPAELRQAAYLYLDLNAEGQALDCLTRAVRETENPSVALLFDLTCQQHRLHRDEEALLTLRRAVAIEPDSPHLYLAQADLLAALDRPGEALTALETAVRLHEGRSAEQNWSPLRSALAPLSWQIGDLRSIDLSFRYALLLKRTGDLEKAWEQADKAAIACPQDLSIRVLAAELAVLLGKSSAQVLAGEWFELDAETLNERYTACGTEDVATSAAVACTLKAAQALDDGKLAEAKTWSGKATGFNPDHPRSLAMQVRVLAEDGDVRAAGLTFDILASARKNVVTAGLMNLNDDTDGAWYAEAEWAARRWDSSLERFQRAVDRYPTSPQPALAYLRALVRTAEEAILCQDLRCKAHAPTDDFQSEAGWERFAQTLEAAQRVAQPEMLAPWQARAEAAYHPNEATTASLINHVRGPQDAAACLMAIRRAGLPEDVQPYLNTYGHEVGVMAQAALLEMARGQQDGGHAQRVVERAPRNPLWHVLYALSAELNGEPHFALESLNIALDLWPNEPSWHAWAADACDDVGLVDGALEHWEAAANLRPENLSYGLRLGLACYRSGDLVRAAEILTSITLADPGRAEAWLALARTLLDQKRYEEAITAVRSAMEHDPESPRPFTLAAEVFLAAGDPFEALHQAQQAAQRSDDDDRAVLLQCQALVQLGDEEQAVRVLEEAIQRRPLAELLQLERVRLLYQKEGAARVRAEMDRLGQTFPESAEIRAMQAIVSAECGDFFAAERCATYALRLDPDQPDLHLLLGHVYKRAGQLDQAVHHLSMAIRQSPRDLDTYLELGKVYQQRREHAEALRTFRQAMTLAPQDYRPTYLAALALREAKDYEGAEQMLRQAAELAPNDVNIRRQLGAVVALNLVHHSQEAHS